MKESLEVTRKQKRLGLEETPHNVEVSMLPLFNADTNAKPEIHMDVYRRAIRQRLWMIIGVTILSTAFAALYMARQQDVYEAKARVQVDLENNPAVGVAGKDSVATSSTINDPTYFSTQLQILMGSGLLRRVVKTLDLEHNRDFQSPQPTDVSTWRALLRMVGLGGKERISGKRQQKDELPLPANPVAPPTSTEDLEEARRLAPYLAALQKGLIVEPVKDTRLAVRETPLTDIRFSQPKPQTAAKVP